MPNEEKQMPTEMQLARAQQTIRAMQSSINELVRQNQVLTQRTVELAADRDEGTFQSQSLREAMKAQQEQINQLTKDLDAAKANATAATPAPSADQTAS